MDLTQGTPQEKNNRAKKMMLWFGMVSLFMSFAGWTSAIIIRSREKDWLKELQLPDVFWFGLIILLLSSVTLIIGKRALKNGNEKLTTIALLATLGLGILFVFLQFEGFSVLIANGYHFTGEISNPKSSFIFLLAFMHILHVFVGLICLLVVTYNQFKQKYNSTKMLGFELAATFWHFIDVLWVYLFLFLYFFR